MRFYLMCSKRKVLDDADECCHDVRVRVREREKSRVVHTVILRYSDSLVFLVIERRQVMSAPLNCGLSRLSLLLFRSLS